MQWEWKRSVTGKAVVFSAWHLTFDNSRSKSALIVQARSVAAGTVVG
jgi:hypothetical protein